MLAESTHEAPAALLLESPWVDLSREEHGLEELSTAARLYAGGVPRTEPRLSPLLGGLSALPPVHLVTGSHDELIADARRLDSALTAAGAEHEYLEIPEASHAVAIRGEGPASQRARRFQIAAVRGALGMDGGAAH